MNDTTGAVLVQNGKLLDRETRSIYYANLQAKDGGGLVGTTVLEITVLDENDMAPIITGSYFISVEEGQNVSTQIQVCTEGDGGDGVCWRGPGTVPEVLDSPIPTPDLFRPSTMISLAPPTVNWASRSCQDHSATTSPSM